jgi:hypothetical protein
MATKGGGIGRLLRQLGSDDWLSRVVDNYFATKSPERWVQPDYTIHPSGSGPPCALAIELWMLGHRGEVKSRNRRRMDNGTDAHTRWQRYFAEMRILVAKEWPLRGIDPTVSGKIDLILQNPATGNLSVGEIKTTNSRKFASLPAATADRTANAKLMYAWHREWFLQFVWYSVDGDYNGRKFTEKFFLIENTDDQDFRIIYVEPTPEHIEEARRAAVAAQNAILGGELLVRSFAKGDRGCKWCDHDGVCDLLSNGEAGTWETIKKQFKRLGIQLKTPGPGK